MGWLSRTSRPGNGRALQADDAFRAASVTKTVTAVVALRLAHEGRLGLDEPLADQLAPALLRRWRALDSLPRTTPRQLLKHLPGLPNYFGDEAFVARLRDEPRRAWRPVELVDHAAARHPHFQPGQGFAYSDTGYVITGILEQRPGGRSAELYPRGSSSTHSGWMGPGWRDTSNRGSRRWRTTTPTTSTGRRLTRRSTGPAGPRHHRELTRFMQALWSERLIDSDALNELTRWTPGASFPPGHMLRYERYGLDGVHRGGGNRALGHTGFIGAFAFRSPEYDAVLVGTLNASQVDRWPLVAALCRELREARLVGAVSASSGQCALLLGLLGNALLGLWWLDPAVALLIACVAVEEAARRGAGTPWCAH